jgi:hypothetical protein
MASSTVAFLSSVADATMPSGRPELPTSYSVAAEVFNHTLALQVLKPKRCIPRRNHHDCRLWSSCKIALMKEITEAGTEESLMVFLGPGLETQITPLEIHL